MNRTRLLIACDLDDTLVPRPDGRATERARAAIKRLQAQGHVFAPVTGRCRVDMPRMLGPRAAWRSSWRVLHPVLAHSSMYHCLASGSLILMRVR